MAEFHPSTHTVDSVVLFLIEDIPLKKQTLKIKTKNFFYAESGCGHSRPVVKICYSHIVLQVNSFLLPVFLETVVKLTFKIFLCCYGSCKRGQ